MFSYKLDIETDIEGSDVNVLRATAIHDFTIRVCFKSNMQYMIIDIIWSLINYKSNNIFYFHMTTTYNKLNHIFTRNNINNEM